MRLCAFISLVTVIVADLAYKIINNTNNLLEWQEVILLTLIIFVAVGDRIVKLAIGKEGITIEQDLNAQIKEAEKDIKSIISLSNDQSAKNIGSILTRVTGQKKDVWSRLVLYRLSLRVLLRKLCKRFGMQLGNTTSLTRMIKFLRERNVIDAVTEKNIELLRDVTFFFEWGTGNAPSVRRIEKALKIAPELLSSLENSAKLKQN